MIRVEWTETALDELDAIRAYLGPFNPPAAHRVARALLAAAIACRCCQIEAGPYLVLISGSW